MSNTNNNCVLHDAESSIYSLNQAGAPNPLGYSEHELEILEMAATIAKSRINACPDPLSSPSVLRHSLSHLIGWRATEAFGIIFLDNQLVPLGVSVLFEGDITSTNVYTRQVLEAVLKTRHCTQIIAFHNHPSGKPLESEADKRITDKIKMALDYLECRLVDHLIVTADPNSYVSFAEKGLI